MQTTSRLPSPYRPEAAVVAQHRAQLDRALDWTAVAQEALPWVQAVRKHPPPFWAMESLLKEYPISSAEGLALMRLAEALLRVPDVETALALTADQLGRADFEADSDSTLARLSSLAIGWSKNFLGADPEHAGLMRRLGARAVVSAALRAVQLLGHQFVFGQDMRQAMDHASRARKDHPMLRLSFDMLGEGARTAEEARRYLAAYQSAIEQIALHSDASTAPEHNDGISIKLSALHPRYEALQHARVMQELVPRVWTLCEQAARANINLTIDAEEVDRLELSLDVLEALAALAARHCPHWRGLGLALQAYQTRSLELVQHVIALARKYQLRLMCRLVKGAYWDAEIKRSQELGLPHYPVFTHKPHTDIAYLACAQALLGAGDAVFAQFASHNAGTLGAIVRMAQGSGAAFELQRLHGMGEGVYREVLRSHAGLACRVYAPVGQHRDLLAYLVRRLLENGANSSFVRQLSDAAVSADVLLQSPLELAPSDALPLPKDLYGKRRRNSEGLDLSEAASRQSLEQALAASAVPAVAPTPVDQIGAHVKAAHAAFGPWACRPVKQRADCLRAAADALQAQLPQFCALLVQEAHKSWADAVSEVREAIDFLRYYAAEAERIMQPQSLDGPTGEANTLQLTARGAWVCISPWNFPLAIFTGQVAAALATGNAVIAKPAEQTPGVAAQAVAVLHRAGVPREVLQMVNGPGETAGAALVAAPQVAGVVFTGSTAVAKIIQRALAAKDGPLVPLIAETGGVNAMLVDSTALPQQVSDAVLQSAFKSAGQRCSALRLLCVHEAVADEVIALIRGAAQELTLGDSREWSTDVGPVIDDEACQQIGAHLGRLAQQAQAVWAPAAPQQPVPHLIAPQIYEVEHIAQVRQEIFGPVLQICRWRGEPAAVIEEINALGYGLTLGLQTRIDSRAAAWAEQAHVGNVYINRNMTGAVVGVQPFGGQGLSGTGPKAGGPHYLHRFCTEKTITVNTTAAGGNVGLMA